MTRFSYCGWCDAIIIVIPQCEKFKKACWFFCLIRSILEVFSSREDSQKSANTDALLGKCGELTRIFAINISCVFAGAVKIPLPCLLYEFCREALILDRMAAVDGKARKTESETAFNRHLNLYLVAPEHESGADFVTNISLGSYGR